MKARSIRRRPAVGALLRNGDRSVVLIGQAEILSVWAPTEAFNLARSSIPAAFALADFARRNIGMLLGYTMDLARMPSGAVPVDRVVISVRPQAGLLLDGDDVSESRIPEQIEPASAGHIHAGVSQDVELPAAVAALTQRPRRAAVGWTTSIGPVVLPGRWDPQTTSARISEKALHVLEAATTSPACITIDDSKARRPTRFRGVMLRGMGHTHNGDVDLALEQATWWKGFQTGTVLPEPSGEKPRTS